jgi:hypothetical protein
MGVRPFTDVYRSLFFSPLNKDHSAMQELVKCCGILDEVEKAVGELG